MLCANFFLLLAIVAFITVSAAPAPQPRLALKQVTRQELLRRQENRISNRKRAVPLPSNKGYPDCTPGSTGSTTYAVFSNTSQGQGAVLANPTATPRASNNLACVGLCQNTANCVFAEFNPIGNRCALYSTPPDSLLRAVQPYSVFIRGQNCAQAVNNYQYSSATANCCNAYI